MGSLHRIGKLVAVSMLVATLSLGAAVASAEPVRRPRHASGCDDRGPLDASALPAVVSTDTCDLVGRTVRSGALKLRVPRPGHAVGAAALGLRGEPELVITTEPDGDVKIDSHTTSSGDEMAGTAATEPCSRYGIAGCLAPCTDTNFNTYSGDHKVKSAQPWWFKASSTPTSLTVDSALRQIRLGTQNVTMGRNDCGLADPVASTSIYQGRTTTGTGVTIGTTASGARFHSCGSGDGKSVVDFGKLLSPAIGLACWRSASRDYGVSWYIYEADIRLKRSTPWTTTPEAPACFNRIDLQGVVTHERGHAFGLSHTDYDEAHSQQVMYPSAFPCTSYARTLGRGDHMGLDFLY